MHDLNPKYVVVIEHPDDSLEAAAWTEEQDRAEDAAVGILTGIVSQSKFPHPADPHEPFEWVGGAGVYEVGKEWTSENELMGVHSEDVQSLAMPGVWNP